MKSTPYERIYGPSPVLDGLAAVTLSRAVLSGLAKGALQKWIERPSCLAVSVRGSGIEPSLTAFRFTSEFNHHLVPRNG
ncbi:hypothetical protein G3A56_17585 [Rhizobium oryzihabitans]|uniref:Uncharacterized protein n=1 Tax=Rhizobium oryzihabitans TaxID=2267833 RepID=A0A7L5BLU7_9HYPH|nr:hypothetical protein [Rhizobium oryzihabitans]QCM06755.1 hypothetical protein CFBP6626_15275 [Agrobacterium tumefaciens]QIB39763.1 hypothetical protein G3A56_17585 [Rhizobium oryzihabitans]CUX48892.1 hypothetical protein AGR5A_Lc100039 [Agrobacterium genomosp. 5 str. CFBP 6626]